MKRRNLLTLTCAALVLTPVTIVKAGGWGGGTKPSKPSPSKPSKPSPRDLPVR